MPRYRKTHTHYWLGLVEGVLLQVHGEPPAVPVLLHAERRRHGEARRHAHGVDPLGRPDLEEDAALAEAARVRERDQDAPKACG